MSVHEELFADVARAILDGSPIDWASVESSVDDIERPLLDQLRILAKLADVHRDPLSGETESVEESITDLGGQVIGAYRLIELLGRGGMGEVYLGERADGRYEQKVAVKLVKRGMDSLEILRRFARERRILARLGHPGIARLLDGGETNDGRPYFVMDRVEGQPITQYCRTRGVLLEDRLRLFASCCEATDSAHRALVVHRDLKPSNILVTADGHVKILDFGIAKLIAEDDSDAHLTQQGERVITPAYAAPEQILSGGITVGTDVFSLGVVLYELVTGVLPYDRRTTTPHELAIRVEREIAERPSTAARRTTKSKNADPMPQRWARKLRGDLDTIIMKALAHDPQRRYGSAAALAEDLRRYLTSRPVQARPDSRSYRLRKFVIRNRLAVASSGIVAAAVLIALVVSLEQTAAARREAQRAAAAQVFLTSLFEDIGPNRYVGSVPTVRDLLERGSERVDQELKEQPELQAEMHALMGQVFDELSQPKQGEAHWRRAVAMRQALFGSDDARTVKAKKGLAISLAIQRRYSEAELLFRELLENKQIRSNPHELGSLLLNYGNYKRLTGDYIAAENLLERAVALLENAGEDARSSLGSALNNLGVVYLRQGRDRDAIGVLERALAIWTKEAGPRSVRVATVLHNLTQLHRELGELDVAESYGQRALAVDEAVYPPDHPAICGILNELGQVAQKRGDRAKALELYERSLKSYEGSDPSNPYLAYSARLLAALLQEEGQAERAMPLYERALQVRRKAYGDRHPEVGESWLDLARGRLALHNLNSALDAARTGVAITRATLPADSSQLAKGLFILGDVLHRSGRSREALPYLEEAYAIWRKKPPLELKDLADLEKTLAATRAVLR